MIFLRIALRNLVQARRRTFFLGTALMMVTTLLVLLLALSEGLTDTMVRSATILSSGHVNVAGFFKAKPSDAAPIVTHTPEVRAVVEANTPDVDFVIDRGRGWARVISEISSLNVGLTGIDVAEESRLMEALRLAEEREYLEGGRAEVVGDASQLSRPDAALIFAAQAERLGVRVGDPLTITVETMSGARNTAEFQIVAIAKDIGMMSNWSVFTSKAGLRGLYRLDDDVTGVIQVYLKDHTKAIETMGHLREVLSAKGYTLMDHEPQPFWAKFEKVSGEEWTGQQLDLTIWLDEVSFLTWVLTAVNVLSVLLISILVAIIAVGITNSMSMAVRERTTEVGTLRAIGMSRRRVLLMFLLEAALLGLGATLLGGLLGLAIAMGLDAAGLTVTDEAIQAVLMSDTLHLVVVPGHLIAAIIAFTVISSLAALVPAFRASRMQPVTAIQHVG